LIGCSVMVRSPSLPTGDVLGRPTMPPSARISNVPRRNGCLCLINQRATRFFPANRREKRQVLFGGKGGVFCGCYCCCCGGGSTKRVLTAHCCTGTPTCWYRPTRPIHPRWWKAPQCHSRPHLRRPRQPWKQRRCVASCQSSKGGPSARPLL
jgi:hypothetical protein